jgi:hypothetical protein
MPDPSPFLATLLEELPDGMELWAVDLSEQEIHRIDREGSRQTAKVSSSRFGTGGEPDSNRTPLGWHRVAQIIGTDGPADQEYISRRPVPPSGRDDRILSRILWLDGLEAGRNETSHDRYIYIHGTNHPDTLGCPASMGCIRMDPEVLAEWVDQVRAAEDLRVWIGALSPCQTGPFGIVPRPTPGL